MRMLGCGPQPEKIDDIDESQLQVRHALSQDRRRRQGLHRRYVSAAGQDDVRFLTGIGAGARPDTEALGAMHASLIDRRELKMLLFVSDEDVDVVLAAKAVIGG